MECGEQSVMEGTGTPRMLQWHAGSCGTSMKVSSVLRIKQSCFSVEFFATIYS